MPRCLLNSDGFAGRGEGCYLKAEVHSVGPYVKEKRRHDQWTGMDNYRVGKRKNIRNVPLK